MYNLDRLSMQFDFKTESSSNAYNQLFLLTGIAFATYAFVRYAESNNKLNYDSRVARILAGFLALMVRVLHSRPGDLEITDAENKLYAIGPHRTGWEAVVFASKFKGTPPQFFATDYFNKFIPGLATFLAMYKTIPVAAREAKKDKTQSANATALELASQVLHNNGSAALFVQGGFSKLDQEPRRVYPGIAKLALKNNIPIQAIRMDGFWSLQNPLIPVFIRNSKVYRAFLSGLHPNNVHATYCAEIDYHLKNEALSDEVKTEEICAQLYAYYRHTQDLTAKQVNEIKTEIASKMHLTIWRNKVEVDDLEKKLETKRKESQELEKNEVPFSQVSHSLG